MDAPKLLEIIAQYRQQFEEMGIKPVSYPHDKLLPIFSDRTPSLEHCHGMLDEMEKFVQEGRLEKTFRWLGFIQGVLWTTRIHTLDHLKDHNRPAE